jgi:hypothetical protein
MPALSFDAVSEDNGIVVHTLVAVPFALFAQMDSLYVLYMTELGVADRLVLAWQTVSPFRSFDTFRKVLSVRFPHF